ncbi:hypothetical protein TPHA_0E03830 [Tetrapisispora phaffii CBS 4417]|uniref:Zn(2)-C6 fungal-type domain-containing protein n=1 Tax=Tetrapisispora phaffii (strain ATCC 24235 / CBS 4417 / NBRC 1672 / NRRL Y-8282 / UCD 70-5) TaxID=1071381 RepID=G8BU94_TETPH|nr:hypothetical protein TPHA_0E03830 [Tetrapisispora phaffii CBS 4417]CCE63472.1 hypothetical protein TPHA_0E03830 [Tetrapisispora phaffii CBS 4417]
MEKGTQKVIDTDSSGKGNETTASGPKFGDENLIEVIGLSDGEKSNSQVETIQAAATEEVPEKNKQLQEQNSNAKRSLSVNLEDTDNEVDTMVHNISGNENSRKFRKKRRTFSCDTCRKFKTRCDFEPLVGKCHRCNMLQINCSLTTEREHEILDAIEHSSKILLTSNNSSTDLLNANTFSSNGIGKPKNDTIAVANPLSQTLNNRLNRMEEKFSSLESKLELILMQLQGSSNAEYTAKHMLPAKSKNDKNYYTRKDANIANSNGHEASNNTDNSNYVLHISNSMKEETFNGIHLKEPPLKLINAIDERLFPSEAKSDKEKIEQQQRPYVVARVNFLQFYKKNANLCHRLVRDFLVRSHFWIIPGGIKEIDEDYAHKHLFITSVFTIIAMSFDDDEKYAEKQETLYPLVERLLTNTLTMFEELTDFDIEAILYCCMFHISRKSRRHRQLKFNSLVLSNFAISSMLNVIDFHEIKERVLKKDKFDAKDLYHLRILNSLTVCKLEYSISYGNVSPLDRMLMEFNNLTAKFPQANFGDDIKISELNLGDTVNSIYLNFKTYFKITKEKFEEMHTNSDDATEPIVNIQFIFPELEDWLNNWEELLSKDGGGVLLFTYDFYHIMICRSFISEFFNEMKNSKLFLTCILSTMREHAYSLLNGFLRLPPSLIRGAPIFTMHQLVYACLTLCDFLHWFMPDERQHILNICSRIYWHLNTIGEKMNDATDNVGKIIKSIIDTSRTKTNLTSLTNSTIPNGNLATNLPNGQFTVNKIELGNKIQTTPARFNINERQSIPDVDQFNSFEDFFQDFFDNLKPTTQRIFTSNKNSK